MTVSQVIQIVDDIKPNAFTNETKTAWLNEVEGMVQTEVFLFAPVEALPMASSVLRTRLAAGEECENELPASVRRVIRREGLYTKGDEVTNESETGKRACAQPAE